MKKAIAIERRSTARAQSHLVAGMALQDGDIKQAEATLWPNCLTVAELQLDAVQAVSPAGTNGGNDNTMMGMGGATPQRGFQFNGNGSDAMDMNMSTDMPITDSTGANHNVVMGVLEHNVISTADIRLDAIRERVLARIWGKQRRLDTG